MILPRYDGRFACLIFFVNSMSRLLMTNTGQLHWLDHLVIGGYLLGTLGLGFLFRKQATRREFFAAGGTMGWLTVGLSVMATLFSANSFVFYPSAAYGDSLRIALSLVAFLMMAPLVVWVFIPVYARLGCETAYDYLERRFHVSVRCLASGLFILLRIGWMASATYAASLAISGISGIEQQTIILTLGAVAIIYTMLGGLRAVMWTDVVQFFVFATTIFLALALLVSRSDGGLSGMLATYFSGREKLIVDFEPSLTVQYGSWAILIGVFLEGLSAFGADQVAVQRYIAARSEKTSQIGFGINLLGMHLVIPGLLLIGVGLYAYFQPRPEKLVPVLVEHVEKHAATRSSANDPVTAKFRDSQTGASFSAEEIAAYYRRNPELIRRDIREADLEDRALPQFVRLEFPPGVVGLLLAALMAAVMSSIDSGIHSVTTAVLVDFRDRLWPRLKPATPRAEMLLVRSMVLVIGLLAVTLALLVGPLGNVFDIGKKVTAAFGGPLLAVFVLGLFTHRIGPSGTFVGALIGAQATLWLMYARDDWFSVWFWPIGFTQTIVSSLLVSLAVGEYFGAAASERLTFWKVWRSPRD